MVVSGAVGPFGVGHRTVRVRRCSRGPPGMPASACALAWANPRSSNARRPLFAARPAGKRRRPHPRLPASLPAPPSSFGGFVVEADRRIALQRTPRPASGTPQGGRSSRCAGSAGGRPPCPRLSRRRPYCIPAQGLRRKCILALLQTATHCMRLKCYVHARAACECARYQCPPRTKARRQLGDGTPTPGAIR